MKNISIISILVLLIACSKGSVKEKDNESPVITVIAPSDNQVFVAGQSITISGNVTDNKYIQQIHIEIFNLATAQEYLHVHIHPNAGTFNFTQPFTAQAGINYKIRVTADDASTNSSVKSVEVSCN